MREVGKSQSVKYGKLGTSDIMSELCITERTAEAGLALQ
jgi:hypothetical protein